jgi:hypothetical protein
MTARSLPCAVELGSTRALDVLAFSILGHVNIRAENPIGHCGRHSFDTTIDESPALIDDLVSVETSWHGSGDDKALETSGKELGSTLEGRLR